MAGYAVIEAPSVLGLRPTGVEHAPEALIDAGIAERLGARAGGRVEPPPYNHDRDPVTRVLNADGIMQYSVHLADTIGQVLEAGDTPFVVGGDCSIVLGSMLALRRRGRFGLLFVDGHADFYQPEAEPAGEAASMDLALVTGRGPAVVTDPEGLRPLVRDEDVALLGYRDGPEAARYGSQPLPDTLWAVDLDEIRRQGIARAAEQAIAHLTRPGIAGFWLHLDVDVLDDEIMPAVDYRLPGGLALDELATVLRMARQSERLVGVELTIFNPMLDPTGNLAAALARSVGEALNPPLPSSRSQSGSACPATATAPSGRASRRSSPTGTPPESSTGGPLSPTPAQHVRPRPGRPCPVMPDRG